jgi:hypothetical protein
MLPDEADTQPDSAGPMPARSRERRGPFGLQGRVKRAGYWGVRNYAEAAALGIPRPMRRSYRATRSARGSSRPGFFLPWGPDPEDPDSDGLVLPEVDRLPGMEEPATRRTTASAPAEAGTPRPDESRRPAGLPRPQERRLPPIWRPEYRRLAKGRHLDRDRPRLPAS